MLVLADSAGHDAVPSPLCRRCYQEMDEAVLWQAIQLVESEQVAVISENRPVGGEDRQAQYTTQSSRKKSESVWRP